LFARQATESERKELKDTSVSSAAFTRERARIILFSMEGNEGLCMRKAKGRKSKLNSNQKKMLVEILVSGAKKYGYKTDLWTSKRVCKVIEKEFEVEYHFKYIPKLLSFF
jgi:transposase